MAMMTGGSVLRSRGQLLMLVSVAMTTATADPHDTSATRTIHIGYFMAEDPHRAAAINLAIAQAQQDGMLSEYNFR